ncbi:MAG: DedA family protein [Alphaproteobacteria bacterium]|nr:DedA family protein [Alphaproteobacteria bacterium]
METLFQDAAAPLTHFVETHAAWAGAIVFAICFLESLALVSAIVPATVMLIGIGSLAAAGLLDLGTLSLWGIAGAGLGFWISFEAGRRYAKEIEALPWLQRRPELVARGHAFFERWGAMAVFAGRFVGPARVVVPMLAGTLGVEARSFHVANWASAILWAPLLLAPSSIGNWLAREIAALPPPVRASILIALGALVVVAIRAFRGRR